MMTRCTVYWNILTFARGVENIPVGCSILMGKNKELVKSFWSHSYPKLIFDQYMFAPCAGMSRFVVIVLQRSDF